MKNIVFWITIVNIAVCQISMKNIQDGKKYELQIKQGGSIHLIYEGDFRSNNDIQFQFQNKDLDSFMSDIKVYLSQKNQVPNQSKFGKQCEDVKYYQNCEFKYDTNNIMHESTDKKKQRLFMTIECSQETECSFSIRTIHSSQLVLPMVDNTPEIFQVRSHKDEFKLLLPLPKNDTNYEYLIIDIDVMQISHQKLNDGFNPMIKTNDGYNVTQFSSDHKMVAVIDKNENDICNYCYVPFIVQLPSNSLFQLNYSKRKYNGTELKLNTKINDNIKPDIFKTYLIKGLDISKTYKLSLSNVNGRHKKLFANALVQPVSRDKYEWISGTFTDSIQDDIVITRDDLQRIAEQTGQPQIDIHVGVFSYGYGFFVLSIDDIDDHQIPLSVGNIESGIVVNNQIVNYKLQIWDNKQKEKKQKVDMIMITESGKLDLFIRKCKSSSCQSISQKDTNQKAMAQQDIQVRLGNSYGYQVHTFKPDCEGYDEVYCYYVIGIKGNSNTSTKSFYNLRTYYQEGFQVLHEDEPQQVHIDKNVPTKLKYTYSDSMNVLDSIKFMVSNNNVDFQVKTGSKCYSYLVKDDIQNKDCKQFKGSSLVPVLIKKEYISSNVFYLILYSPITTNALVEVQVYQYVNSTANSSDSDGSDKQKNVNLIQLHQGINYNGQLTKEHEVLYFRINMDQKDNEDIFVTINGVSNNYIIRGKQGQQLVDKMNYDWISNDNVLIINYETNPTAYQKSGQYTVMVECGHKVDKQNVQFSIQYYVPSQIMNVNFNQPIYNRLYIKRQITYYFYVDSDIESDIYLMTHIIHNSNTEFNLDQNLQVSINSHPKPSTNEILKRQWHQQYESVDGYDWQELVLEAQSVKQLCEEQKQKHNIQHCRLYVQIFNPNTVGLEYMFQIQYSRNKLQIHEGKQTIIDSQSIQQNREVQLLLVPEKVDQNIDLQLQSHSSMFSVELSVENRDKSLGVNRIRRVQSSQHNNRHLLVIENDDMIHCRPNCIIKTLVYFSEKDKQDNGDRQFRIYVDVVGLITQVQDSKQYTMSIQKDQIKYFRYDFIDQNTGFQNQMNALHGMFTVYYKICSNDELVFPNPNDFDSIQVTNKYQMEKEQLSKLIIQKHDKIRERQNGIKRVFMMIGVGLSRYGNHYNEGLFEMKITHKFSRYYSLYMNHYQQFHVSEKDYSVFKIYEEGVASKLWIKTVRKTGGQYSFKHSFCDYNQDNIKDQFSNCVNHITQQNDLDYYISNEDQLEIRLSGSRNCEKCMLVVIVKAINDDLEGMLMIKKEGHPENLNQQTDYQQQLKQGQVQSYQLLEYGRFNLIHLKMNLITGMIRVYQHNSSNFDISKAKDDYYTLDKHNNVLDMSIEKENLPKKRKSQYSVDYDDSVGYDEMVNYLSYRYIYVEGISDCLFSISYSYSRNQIQDLNDGQVVSSYFVQENVNTKKYRLQYDSNGNGSNAFYVLVQQNYKNQIYNLDYLTINYSYENHQPGYQQYQQLDYNKVYLNEQQIKVVSKGHDFIVYKVLQNAIKDAENPSNILTMDVKLNQTIQDSRSFIFDIVKQENNRIVTAQNSDLTLVDDNHQVNMIQVFIEDSGYLMVEVQQCVGSLHVETIVEYRQFGAESDDLDMQSMSHFKVNEPKYIRVKQGTLSIKVVSFDQMAIAKIRTRYFNDQEFAKEEVLETRDIVDYYIENTQDNTKHKVQISVYPIQCLNCHQIHSNAYIDYKVIVSDRQEPILKAGVCKLCDYQHLKDHNYQEKQIRNISLKSGQDQSRRLDTVQPSDNSQTLENGNLMTTFELQNRGAVYYVQVVGVVRNSNNNNERVLVYPIKEIVNPVWYQTSKGQFKIWLSVVAILVLLGLVWMIRSRNILLQKKIKYEMSDVRNIAAIRGDQTYEMSQVVEIKGIDNYQTQRL